VNVVDSSAWIEYFAGRANAPVFRPVIIDLEQLLVPVITLFEVYKWMVREAGAGKAQRAVNAMRQGQVVELDADLAIAASKLSLEHHLPMADSLIYATGQKFQALVWTQDDDFRNLPGVRYYPKSDH
jgi:predicted nucleic acid-binding protein